VESVDESAQIRSENDLFSDDFTPVAQPVVERAAVSRGRGENQRGRGRGRGGSRGGASFTGLGNDSAQPAPALQQNETQQPSSAPAPDNAPTAPRKEGVTSVRGDRHATGGLRKPKLTEDELAEKMAKISIRNAELNAAHARAEADAASFAEREVQAKQQAAQRQKVERKDRQQMMGEREKNRMRKLKASEGREWDAEKREEDFQKGGRSDKLGGFAGDQEDYSDGREYLYKEPRGDSGYGGGRGGRGGRGKPQSEVSAPRPSEFPALPVKPQVAPEGNAVTGAEPGAGNHLAETQPADGKASWADQVESANA